jgi:hypothetical protein
LEFNELTNILHDRIERGEMPARTAGLSMSAQVEAEKGMARIVQGFAHVLVSSAVFAEPVDEADHSFGLSLRFPTLHVEGDVVIHVGVWFGMHGIFFH